MESSEDISSTNGLLRVFSPVNGQDSGMIQLHKEWRAKQSAKIEFLPVLFENMNDETRIKALMYLEPSKQEPRSGEIPWDSFERVQLIDRDVDGKDWLAMIEGSPASRGRVTGFIC
jgi:hypothetical protein